MTARLGTVVALAGGCGLLLWTQVLAQPENESQEDAPAEAAAPAEPASSEAPVEAPDADQKDRAQGLLARSRETLVNLKSIKTRLVETVAIGQQRFKAVGSYLQGTDLRLRLELSLQFGALKGSLLEVCDGEVLWTDRRVGETARITRRDVREITKVAAEVELSEETLLQAELGLGGLPALLAAIQQSMAFDSYETQVIDGETFQVIEGGWNDEVKQQFAATPGMEKRLPDHVPERVRIYFDQSDLPRRIVYLKQRGDAEGLSPLVTIDFEDMVLNPPISAGEFEYEPPDHIPRTDITHQYIERLRASGAK